MVFYTKRVYIIYYVATLASLAQYILNQLATKQPQT